MSRQRAVAPGRALRMLLLLLSVVTLAGCGQKGDLYRPVQSGERAAISDVPRPV